MTNAIDKKYRTHLWISRPLGPENTCADGLGRFREYEAGASIYYHPGSGAHLIYGLIRKKWIALGREKGPNGYPTSDEADTASGDGRYNNFQSGTIIWKKGTPEAFAVCGAIYDTWAQAGYDGGLSGFPVTDEKGTSDNLGRHSDFERTSIYYHPTTGAHLIWGLIRKKWIALGREKGPNGYPTSDEADTASGDGRYNNFQSGTIIWKKGTPEAFAVCGAIYDTWAQAGYDGGLSGFPVTDEKGTSDNLGRHSDFERTSIYYHPTTGAHLIWGLIRKKWIALGREKGPNGYPTSDEADTASGDGRYNNFQSGTIIWKKGTPEAFTVYGAIYDTWAQAGYDSGLSGFPVTDEKGTSDNLGRHSDFERTSIYYHPSTGAHLIWGLIRKKWIALGREKGPNGYPTSDEADTASGDGRYNNFQSGTIIWKKGTPEAFTVYGAIYQKWAQVGSDNGFLKFPITDENATPGNLGRYSEFERGAIYYNSSTGTHVVRSPVLEAWTLEGREQSALQLPVSDTDASNGSGNAFTQTFQGGTISCSETVSRALVSSGITCQIAPGTREAVLTDSRDAGDNRTYPLMRLNRHLNLKTALVIFRGSYTRTFTDADISDLKNIYGQAISNLSAFTFGLARIGFIPVVIESVLSKSDFIDVKHDDDPATPQEENPDTFHAAFRAYEKVKQALNVDDFDIVHINIPWADTATDIPGAFAWANPKPKFDNTKTWSTGHYIYSTPAPYWWAFYVHETFHCLEWMLETHGYPELRNPDDRTGVTAWWLDSYPQLTSSPIIPVPVNVGNNIEYDEGCIGYAMLSRIKEHWFDLLPTWGKISIDGSIDGSRDLLVYSSPDSNTLVETMVHVSDLPN